MASGDNVLTIDVIHEKLNQQNKKIKNEKEEKVEKNLWVHTISSTNNGAESVLSTATNLENKNVLKIEMKKKKNIRKQKI